MGRVGFSSHFVVMCDFYYVLWKKIFLSLCSLEKKTSISLLMAYTMVHVLGNTVQLPAEVLDVFCTEWSLELI